MTVNSADLLRYTCEECRSGDMRAWELLEHTASVHAKMVSHACACGANFFSSEMAIEHADGCKMTMKNVLATTVCGLMIVTSAGNKLRLNMARELDRMSSIIAASMAMDAAGIQAEASASLSVEICRVNEAPVKEISSVSAKQKPKGGDKDGGKKSRARSRSRRRRSGSRTRSRSKKRRSTSREKRRRRRDRSRSPRRHASRSASRAGKVKVEKEKSEEKETALRKVNLFLTKALNNKKKLDHEETCLPTPETSISKETQQLLSEMSSDMDMAINKLLEGGQERMEISDDEAPEGPEVADVQAVSMPIPLPMLVEPPPPTQDPTPVDLPPMPRSEDQFEQFKNQYIFSQCMNGQLRGFQGPPRRRPLLPGSEAVYGVPGLPIYNPHEAAGPGVAPAAVPTPSGRRAVPCPFHPNETGHSPILCASMIPGLDERIAKFKEGGGCPTLRCMKKHRGECRASNYCSMCQQPHHLLFCPIRQMSVPKKSV